MPKVALIFDFDLTLSPYFAQKVMIEKWQIDEIEFWKKCTAKVTNEGYDLEHGYIKVILEYIEENPSFKLSNGDLYNLGKKITLYEGLSRKNGAKSIFEDIETILKSEKYNKLNLELECYVISGGLVPLIQGALEANRLSKYFKEIFACRLNENQEGCIDFPKETVGHTIKTQKLFKIAKGLEHDVNEKIENYAIPFENMIYLGDGQTDIPAFSLVNKMGGKSIAVYREIKNLDGSIDIEATRKNYEKIHKYTLRTNRVLELLPADYSENRPLKQTIENYVTEICERELG
jgi:2-hydroxy-3-keto-5-methylthiopentenyl-1-phosphate phosphatase